MQPAVGLLLLAGLLYLLALAQNWSLLSGLGHAVVLTVLLAALWSWASTRGIYVRARSARLRVQVGEYLDERLEIENLSWLPRPWLEIIDAGDFPGHNLSELISLGPKQRRARRLRTLCRRRGRFILGPLTVASGDPFGLFRRERIVAPACEIIVLPRPLPLVATPRLPGDAPGGSLQRVRVYQTTPSAAALREYQPGDAFNRIHWPTTARLGRLMVKEFEHDPQSDVWLLLDLDRLVQAGAGDETTEEYAVTIAASLAHHFLIEERAVGLLTQGGFLPRDRGYPQLARTLEFLAVQRASRGQPLDEVLAAHSRKLGRRDSLVVITPSRETTWVAWIQDLRRRGVATSAVLIDAPSFAPGPSYEGTMAALRDAGLTVYRVQRGGDLSAALAGVR